MMDNSVSEPSSIGDKQKVIRGGVFLTASPAAALILGVFITVLIGDYILPEEYAVFEWFNVMSSFFLTIIPFQIPNAIGRYIAVAKGGADQSAIESLVKSATVLSLMLVPVSGIVAFTMTPFVFSFVGIGAQYSILDTLIFSVGVMSLNLSAFTQSVSSGFQEFEKLGIARFLGNLVSQGFLIVLIPLGWGIRALLTKWVLLGLFTAILLTLTIRRIWSLRGSLHPLKPLIAFAYPAIISFLFAYALNELLVRSIFQLYADQNELGLYGFAVRLTTFINALTLGFHNAIGPHYAQAVGQGGSLALGREVQWTLKMSFFLFLPLIMGTIVIAPAVFRIVFPVYYWSYRYFAILMMQLFFFLFVRPYSSVLGAVAKTKQVLVSSVVASIVSGILMLLMIDYGLLFVVIGYASGAFFYALVTSFWVKRDVGIGLGVRQVAPMIITSFATIVPAALIHFMRPNPFVELAANLVMFFLIYLVSIRFLRLVTANEIRKATLFLPERMSSPLSRFLIRLFTRNGVDS